MKHQTHIATCVVLLSAAGLPVQRASADVAFEQVETVTTGAFTTLDIPKPSGTVEDELLIAIVSSEKGDPIDSPSGWTVIDDGLDGDKANSRTTVVYKVAGPSEPTFYTFTSSGKQESAGGDPALQRQ